MILLFYAVLAWRHIQNCMD